MSRYLILLLFVLMSACSAASEEGSTLSERTNTRSPIADSPSVTPSATQMPPSATSSPSLTPTQLASATSSPSLTPTLLKPTATPSPMTTATEEVATATATRIPITPEVVPMVVVPAGEFLMGIDVPYFVGEGEQSPSHEVYLDEFYFDQYEVTVAQFVLFLNALGEHKAACDEQDCVRLEDESSIEPIEGGYRSMDGKEKFPILATWHGAQAYCQWVGKRLPTEAEWEKAARGVLAPSGEGLRQYPWGDEPLSRESVGKWFELAAVGSHPADVSPYEVFDLYGNAREWTQDWYQRTYDSSEPLNNPLGAAENNSRHKNIRSGVTLPSYVTYRSSLEISQEAGFRCAVSTSPLLTPTAAPPTLTPTSAPTVTPTLRPSLTPSPTLPLTPITAQEVPMVEVPAGEFLMGSTSEQVQAWNEEWSKYNQEIGSYNPSYFYSFIDEVHQFSLYLDEFSIDQLEVSNAHYQRCVEAQVCSSPRKERDKEPFNDPALGDYPVINVRQGQAARYCKWAGKRLPTEAEWEKAARGSDGRIYPWGNEWEPKRLNTQLELKPVGSFADGASPYGALDMVGNAAEWTQDTYAPYPGQELPQAAFRPLGKPLFRGGMAYPLQVFTVRGLTHLYSPLPHLQLRTTIRHVPTSPPENPPIGFRCVRGPITNTKPLSDLERAVVTPTALPTQSSVDLSQMAKVPAGKFMMGNNHPSESETRAHEVYLSDYYIDKYEVTTAQYVMFLNALGADKLACNGNNCLGLELTGWQEPLIMRQEQLYQPRSGKERSPAQVSWHGASAYCEWLGKRLPTEAEWEKAARGTDGRKYPWGDEELYSRDLGESDASVGSHRGDTSPYGIFDMYGTAYEWTADWYDANYYRNSPTNNPTGPEGPKIRDGVEVKVVRSNLDPPSEPVTARSFSAIFNPAGFRCAYTPATAAEPLPETPILSSPIPTLTATPSPQHTLAISEEMPMVQVSAGEFLMGSTYEQITTWTQEFLEYYSKQKPRWLENDPANIFANERYQLKFYLESFEIDQYEVTNGHYKRCVEAGKCSSPKDKDLFKPSTYADYPVKVRWQQAQDYCQWVGKRLPTEAEWEKAARGIDGRIYPWGNEWDETRLNIQKEFMPVGSFPEGASPVGAQNMIGNAPEWTASWATDDYADYKSWPATEEPSNESVIVRGGQPLLFWGSHLLFRTAVRWAVGKGKNNMAGFRCVQGAEQASILVESFTPTPIPTQSAVELSQMVLIPAGEFIMGTDDPGFSSRTDNTPAHLVSLDEYYIDRYEVTNTQFSTFLNTLGGHRWVCDEQDCIIFPRQYSINIKLVEQTYKPVTGTEAWPVEATWHGASAYCEWLGKRLPTEAEWEKAARGTDGRKYPWGNELFQSNEIASHHPLSAVGSHPHDVSLFGVFDTLGNAEEWVADWYDENLYAKRANVVTHNPLGPAKPSSDKVLRGERSSDGITVRYDSWTLGNRGFRCAYSP